MRPGSLRRGISRLTFKRKIRAAVLITTMAGVLVAQLLLTVVEWDAGRTQLAREHQALAEVLAANASAALVFNDRAAAEETLRSAWQAKDVRSVALFDARGALFARVESRASSSDGAAPKRASLIMGRSRSFAPVGIKGSQVGELVLTYDLTSLYARLLAFVGSGLATFVAAGFVALMVSRKFAGLIAEPVENLSETISEVRRSRDFTRRVEVGGADEFGRLTHDFNALLADLQSNEELRTTLLSDLRRALQDAEAANVAKSQFLANMSHEIRTPLNGVLGMTQALAMGKLEPTQRERVDIIKESGQSLLAVLNDILDLSKIEAGKFELEVVDFNLEDVARGACAAFTETANRKGVSFGFTIAAEAQGIWKGDSARVRQILYNLISNGLKFTSVGEVRVLIDRGLQGELVISVNDTGIGIAADKLPRLFTKFFQTDSSTTRRFGGTGLGLAICRELTELMGGEVSATSLQGYGSTFRVALKLDYVGPTPSSKTHADDEERFPSGSMGEDQPDPQGFAGNLRILAAEDNHANQLVLRALLQAFEITPTVVGNGQLAVELWAQQTFDLILMDIQMPEMDGVTATQKIREMEAQSQRPRTPIVALSANAMKHQVEAYLLAGMDEHLAKPIEVEKLYSLLTRVFEAASTTDAPDAAILRA